MGHGWSLLGDRGGGAVAGEGRRLGRLRDLASVLRALTSVSGRCATAAIVP
ncbi:hypothetical protein FM106_23275 [Brachybacterium faecium]|nr:hypothetical protein FM106_23275 [Brachybacterium faecium]